MSNRRHDEETARLFFVAGYRLALNEVARYLAIPSDSNFLTNLSKKIDGTRARTAFKKAIKSLGEHEGQPIEFEYMLQRRVEDARRIFQAFGVDVKEQGK